MKKFKLVLIGIVLLICTILVVVTNNTAKKPACKSAPVQEGNMDVHRLEFEWYPPYPFGI